MRCPFDKVTDVDKKTGAVKKVTEPSYVGKPIGKSQAVWLREWGHKRERVVTCEREKV